MNKNDIKLSIITVCYNSEKTIRQTIESVLNQSYAAYEYIIIDGESSDATMEIVYSYIDLFRLKNIEYKIVSEKDFGIYDAMNKGINNATGELIGILNSDDWYEPNALELIKTNYLSFNKQEAIYYGAIKIWKFDREYRIRQNHHNFLNEHVTQHPTCFVSKYLYLKYGLYDSKLRVAADYELLNRMKINGAIFININNIITNFRIGGMSDKAALIGAKEYNQIKFKFGYITKKQYTLTKLKTGIFSFLQILFK